MLKRTIFSVLCAALLAIAAAYAQPSATITLRSGQTITGQLVDFGGVGYMVRVNEKDQEIPASEVAVIDFTGRAMSDADWANFRGSPKIVLKSGQAIDGHVTDVSGTSPLTFTVQTSNGTQQISSNDVARVLLARPANLPVATTGTNPQVALTPAAAGAIGVQANQPWTSTGMTVQKGQSLHFTATGTIQLSTDQNDIAGPDGSKTGRKATNTPLTQVRAGELIGRVGTNDQPFPIGSNATVTMPAAGMLYLGVNDDGFGDNVGSFQVVINR